MSSAPTTETPLEFKFLWLDEEGNQTGFRRSKGGFDGETLRLDDVEIPVVVLMDVQFRKNRMLLTAMGEDDEPLQAAILVSGGLTARELKSALDVARSAQWAELHKAQLKEEGREADYRDEPCPACSATLILTDMERTPQLYCSFCDTLSTVDPHTQPVPEERDLRQCEECGMFARPRKFAIFYFWFLLVVYGWKHGSTFRCPACMRGDAWKMFFGNLPFLIGVPNAVMQLIRAYGGGLSSGPFAGLDAANVKARSGDVLGALTIYREILTQVPHAAGVKYNIGLGLLGQDEVERAAESLRMALEDCSNYAPAFNALCSCYEILGESEKLQELQAVWGVQDEETGPVGAPDVDEG